MLPYKILEQLKIEVYRNASRLFIDACILYQNKRFPSCYALSVSSYEEIGKLCMIDRSMDSICMNPESAELIYNDVFESDALKNHSRKHVHALFDANMSIFREKESLIDFMDSKGLENSRNDALYVDYKKRKIRNPSIMTREKAYSLLSMNYAAFEEIEDLAFNGFDCISSDNSIRKYQENISILHKEFQKCSID